MPPKVKLTQRHVAQELGVSEAAVSKMVKNGMPLDSMEAAIIWRQGRQRHRITPAERAQAMAPVMELIKEAQAMPQVEIEEGDFDGKMVAQAEKILDSAFTFYTNAVSSGESNRIAIALKIWGEAGKSAANIRERFLETREKARQLVDLDEVISGVGIEVCEWRRLYQTLGNRLAGKIPPEHVKTINDEIERVQRDLMPRAKQVATDLFTAKEESNGAVEQE